MSRLFLIALTILSLVAVGLGGAELFNFQAFAVVDHGQLEWSTGQESNLNKFIVERSADGTAFIPVGQVNAKGSYSQYDYTDSSPLDVNMEKTFYYRLKILDNDGTFSYSEIREISLQFSAVQQTWGSIKAMFR
jgi:hypothetical protein